MSVTVYGASDDLIEIVGDVREERSAPIRPLDLDVAPEWESEAT